MPLDPPTSSERPIGWHHEQLGIPALWDARITGAGVRVAILDTGLASVRGLDRPGGFEYFNHDGARTTASDPKGHGTQCASIIGSTAKGAPGIAPDASIVSHRVTDGGDVVVNAETALTAIARRGDIDVVLCAFVIDDLPTRLIEQVGALAMAGTIVVMSAGNTDRPAGFPEHVRRAVAVAGMTRAGIGLPSARRGSFIDIAAPGEQLPALNSLGQVSLFDGTSAAAAVVAGVAALMMSTRAAAQRQKLGVMFEALAKASARRLPGTAADTVGAGCVDPAGILKLINEGLP